MLNLGLCLIGLHLSRLDMLVRPPIKHMSRKSSNEQELYHDDDQGDREDHEGICQLHNDSKEVLVGIIHTLSYLTCQWYKYATLRVDVAENA